LRTSRRVWHTKSHVRASDVARTQGVADDHQEAEQDEQLEDDVPDGLEDEGAVLEHDLRGQLDAVDGLVDVSAVDQHNQNLKQEEAEGNLAHHAPELHCGEGQGAKGAGHLLAWLLDPVGLVVLGDGVDGRKVQSAKQSPEEDWTLMMDFT